MDVKRGFGLTGSDKAKEQEQNKKRGVYISDGKGGFIPLDDYINDSYNLDANEFYKKYPREGVMISGDKKGLERLSDDEFDALYRLSEALNSKIKEWDDSEVKTVNREDDSKLNNAPKPETTQPKQKKPAPKGVHNLK